MQIYAMTYVMGFTHYSQSKNK